MNYWTTVVLRTVVILSNYIVISNYIEVTVRTAKKKFPPQCIFVTCTQGILIFFIFVVNFTVIMSRYYVPNCAEYSVVKKVDCNLLWKKTLYIMTTVCK